MTGPRAPEEGPTRRIAPAPPAPLLPSGPGAPPPASPAPSMASRAPGVAPAPAPATGETFRVAERFGPYVVERHLARGGMGAVLVVRHEQLGQRYALKVVADVLVTAETVIRFERETQALAALGKHPNVVSVHASGVQAGRFWYVMDLIEGEPLDKAIAKGPLEPSLVARIGSEVASALAAAHDRGILHRDVKPANVLLDRSGRAVLFDFGLALAPGDRVTRTGEILGTPAYMAPEQALGERERQGPATDVYGLGALLYEIATGHRLFETGGGVTAALAAAIRERPKPPRSWNAAIPPELDLVILRCLEKDPARRYASARELEQELAAIARREGGAAAREVSARSFRRARMAGELVVLAGLGASWPWLRVPPAPPPDPAAWKPASEAAAAWVEKEERALLSDAERTWSQSGGPTPREARRLVAGVATVRDARARLHGRFPTLSRAPSDARLEWLAHLAGATLDPASTTADELAAALHQAPLPRGADQPGFEERRAVASAFVREVEGGRRDAGRASMKAVREVLGEVEPSQIDAARELASRVIDAARERLEAFASAIDEACSHGIKDERWVKALEDRVQRSKLTADDPQLRSLLALVQRLDPTFASVRSKPPTSSGETSPRDGGDDGMQAAYDLYLDLASDTFDDPARWKTLADSAKRLERDESGAVGSTPWTVDIEARAAEATLAARAGDLGGARAALDRWTDRHRDDRLFPQVARYFQAARLEIALAKSPDAVPEADLDDEHGKPAFCTYFAVLNARLAARRALVSRDEADHARALARFGKLEARLADRPNPAVSDALAKLRAGFERDWRARSGGK